MAQQTVLEIDPIEIKIDEIEKSITASNDDNFFANIIPSLGEGLILEFGVSTGESLRQIARYAAPRRVYGFDSFEGLPEDWAKQEKRGAFACEPPVDLPNNVRLEVGLFSETLPGFMAGMSEEVAFAHIDCDLYSSTVCVLENIGPWLADGAILLFDEMIGYEGYRDHEIKAFAEFLYETGFSYEVIGRRHAHSLAVRINQ